MWYVLGMGRVKARPYIGTYLLPISNNLEQVGDENSVAGVGPIDKPTPMPAVDSGLPANGLTESQLKCLPSSPPKQHDLVNLGPTELAASDMKSDESQTGQHQPAQLRWSAHTTKNQLPWRYQNFTPQCNNTTLGAFNVWDGLHTCLHLMISLYNAFWEMCSVKTLYLKNPKPIRHEQFLTWMGIPLM